MDQKEAPPDRVCEAPGCSECAEHRAPKSRDHMNEYYWFCMEHAREYNAKWNYFSGMTAHDIDSHQRNAHTWDRPTWRMGSRGNMEDQLRDKVRRHFGVGDDDPFVRAEKQKQWRREQRAQHSEAARAEIDALAVLDLEPPVDFDKIKARYKQLVKKHHPDVNGGDPASEEKFKAISQAYSVLRTAFEKISSPADA
tara:strand:+ start:1078 stop:1665 length:588 start_codon:yes stop_codon:yes gene_type:complete